MRKRYSISEKWDSADIHRVIEAVEFAIGYFDLEDEKSTLTVKLINGLQESLEATADRIKNKRYEIRLNRNLLTTSEELLKAVFHEMTHVKQFVENGLRIYHRAAKWEKNDYKLVTNEDYWMSPWEMEARAMEEPLYHLFEEIQ
jgi:hypothetical protein